MRAVIQRVTSARVAVGEEVAGEIGLGVLALVGVGNDDAARDAASIAGKIAGLRVFADESGAMNLSLGDVGGAVLAVSQFTLLGDARRGRRPSFVDAAPGDLARPLFDETVALLRRAGLPVATGVFGAQMKVSLVNDGPVTILLDSKRAF
ncbi:MAG: D-tyrosyl-tRNA(Tyr) deacylase [Candidatus Eremiobacteraeota bacterium]|nr:D-tyrosyl-tRNA(Tyr) deacylase [Candidatus Eremiobacteraeota bacterium]MBC5828350.1 D-tyrosyl-tRNA(Tyr) deacylase [Candidatus Eremiobacteraeota bacterium]